MFLAFGLTAPAAHADAGTGGNVGFSGAGGDSGYCNHAASGSNGS